MRRGLFLAVLVVVALSAFPGCEPMDAARSTERYDFPATVQEIRLEGYNGAISWRTLPPCEDPYVLVEKEVRGFLRAAVESHLRSLRIEDRSGRDAISLRALEPSRPQGVTGSSVHYTVYAAPEHIHEFEAFTSNGSVSIQEFLGMVVADTSNGRIHLESGSGIVDLRTSNASIDLGRIRLNGDSRVRTSNGRISGQVDIDRGRNFEFRTSNGNVDLFFPSRMRGQFDLQAINGRIDIDLDHHYGSSRSDLVVGRGDPYISIRTSNGNITVGPARTARTVR